MSATLTAKIISALLLGAISLLLGLLPIKLSQYFGWKDTGNTGRAGQYFISCLNCFGAGVILTTCLTHMLPEVNLFLEYNINNGSLTDTGMHLAEIFVLCGFFMVYITEELTHTVLERCHHNSQHGPKGEKASGENGTADHNHEATMVVDIVNPENSSASSFQVILRGFLVILALSLHAVFEGIAVGLTQTAKNVWYFYFAVAAHKYVISFCIGIQYVVSGLSNKIIIIFISTFALISPLGITLGILLTETAESEAELQGPSITVLQGLAAGTLLYVVFFEVLEKERAERKISGLLQAFCVVLGFAVMVVVQLIEIGAEESGEGESEVEGKTFCALGDLNSYKNLTVDSLLHCVDGKLIPL